MLSSKSEKVWFANFVSLYFLYKVHQRGNKLEWVASKAASINKQATLSLSLSLSLSVWRVAAWTLSESLSSSFPSEFLPHCHSKIGWSFCSLRQFFLLPSLIRLGLVGRMRKYLVDVFIYIGQTMMAGFFFGFYQQERGIDCFHTHTQ